MNKDLKNLKATKPLIGCCAMSVNLAIHLSKFIGNSNLSVGVKMKVRTVRYVLYCTTN